MEHIRAPRRLTAVEIVVLKQGMREALQTMRAELNTPPHHRHQLGSGTMNIEKQRLIERLLAAETHVKFITVREAINAATLVCGERPTRIDAAALEAALHAPMYAHLDGTATPWLLAQVLEDAVHQCQPFSENLDAIAGELGELFRKKNGAGHD